MRHRLLPLTFAALGAFVALLDVVTTHGALSLRSAVALGLGGFTTASLFLFSFAQRKFGLLNSTIVLALCWGLLFFLVALSLPRCPGAQSRCSLSSATSYLGIGLLTPVVVALALGPIVVLVRRWISATPQQRRHPAKALTSAARLRVQRVVQKHDWKIGQSLLDRTTSRFSTKPEQETNVPTLQKKAPSVRHAGRITYSPRHPSKKTDAR